VTQDPDLWSDQKRAQTLFGNLKLLKKQWEPVAAMAKDVGELIELTKMSEPSDLPSLQEQTADLERRWLEQETQLYLGGEFDALNCYLTISSGAGGTEAQDWAAMLVRMYLRYCERRGWKTQLLEKTDGQEAGIKTATFLIQGEMAYGNLKCEKGAHRLVRISPFGAKGLRQTCASTPSAAAARAAKT
jgi:peptide chain release factor 2